MNRNDASQAIREDRDRAGDQALASLERLQRDLEIVAQDIRAARAGDRAYPDQFTPNRQLMDEVVRYGAAYAALWQAAGYLDRADNER